MERAVTAEAQLLGRLQSLRARADKLNEYLYFFGEPDSLQRDLDRYRNATPESVQNVARQVLLPNARLVQWILPEGIEHVASGRDERPGPAPQGAFAPPSTRTFTLSNGIPVDLWVRPGLPLVAAEVLLMPGPRRGDLPAPTATPGVRVVGPEGMVDALDRAGLASLVASMTQEGAGQRDAVAFAQAVAALGGTMTAGSDHASLSISLQVLARHVDAGMTLLADAVLRPRMGPADFERVKRLRQDAIRQQEDRPMTVAGQVAARVLCGPRNPYAWSTLGTEDTVSRLTLDDVRDLYRALFRPACARIFIAGDVTEDKARSTLEEAFGGWRNQGSVSQGPDDLAIPPPSGLRFVVVDRPDAVQTAVYLACPGVPQSDPRRLPLELVHTILGGSFTSRLNRNLREVHGFTYGAFSSQVPHRKIGLMTAQSAVMAESTGAAVREFLGELVRIASGDITPAEVAKARETVKNDITESFGTLRGILANATDLAVRGASLSDVAADLEGIGSLDAARLTAVARDLIRLDRSVLVLVGDRKLILEQTKDLPLPAPEFVDAKGEPLPKESRGR
jgi:predicted Zn-dependent peptidase